MFSKQNKEKKEKNLIKTTETRYVTQTSQTTVETKVVRNRTVSYSGANITPSASFPKLGNNFLAPPLISASNATSTASLNKANLDAKPVVNLQYQSPYRNSAVYGNYQNNQPTNATQPPKTSNIFRPNTISTGTGTAYRPALPATVLPLPTSNTNKKIIVKKTGRFYDTACAVPTYQTHSKNRGKVLIINNIMFKDKGYRHGAKVDDQNLDTLFKQMGFKVKIARDLKKSEMESEVKNFSKKVNSVDIAIVVVMSHGTKNPTLGGTEVFGLDEKGILVDDLIKHFNDADCKQMAQKPKIFIFQCCRGDNEQFIHSDATATPPKVPALTDALIAYSTLPGFVSHRDPDSGTWYVSTLCNVFSAHAHEYHVEDLLKMVDVQLGSLAKNVKQTTHYENRGFKRCYLHPI